MGLIMNIVILAAGQGKRMQSDLPKVLHPLAGQPLLGHVLDTAAQLKPESICVVYGHGGDAVPKAFADRHGIHWARQETQLGTGHAVKQALPYLGEDKHTLILYGDVPLIKVKTLEALKSQAASGLAILTVRLDDPSGYGRIVRRHSEITKIVEQKDATPEELSITEVNTGIMLVATSKLKQWLGNLRSDNAQKEYYLTDIVSMAVEEGISVGSAKPESVTETLGVNSRAQLSQLERVFQRETANFLMDHGTTLFDPERLDIRGSLKAGKDCSIDVNCVFEGHVLLGDRVSIGPNCVIRNVQIGDGTRIEAFCHIDGAHIGQRCSVGPYARLRPATTLDEDVHIGNFVEIKASQIQAGTKAGHLSYLGDSTIGRNVNVGAGTITCNYDGANKHRTIIEDDVFIGSDTQLIAPVTVRRGATLAAGTTLAKEAPEDMLTLSRVTQKSVRWHRPSKKKTP
jgi:bifunctional UDP-N-acetylglucosamine pyrophosphorylase/glucosamine-1-phosphate N-acetyltransferase